MCSVASLDVDKIGSSGRLGLGKNLGPFHHDLNHFSKVLGEIRLFFGYFLSFWAPYGPPSIIDERHGLSGCG